ncbi:MAG TPA: ribosome biogenesis GTP-binding protein YihA/YsxC [Nitrospirota bacterium]|nr:ribosome biogenesis GTP-binding protein YihA/YsxC [Nitrospirota bacterium]
MKILSAEFIISAARPEQFPVDARPQIAFAGRSNVGKSSLINALLHRKGLVKTSATPGKTQLINYFLINEQFYFVDLPGYGYAKAPRSVVDQWAPMIEGYLKGSPPLRTVVLLFDIRREPDARDRRMVEWLRHYQIPMVAVLTKTDKVKRQEMAKAQKLVAAVLEGDAVPILTSASSGLGMKELWSEIKHILP